MYANNAGLRICLQSALMADTLTVAQATKNLKLFLKNPESVCPMIAQISDPNNDPSCQQLAAVLLRSHIAKHWRRLNSNEQVWVKASLLQMFFGSPSAQVEETPGCPDSSLNCAGYRLVKNSVGVLLCEVCLCVGDIAAHWPELLPTTQTILEQAICRSQDQVAALRMWENCLKFLRALIETLPDQMAVFAVTLQAIFFRGLGDQRIKIKAEALWGLAALLSVEQNNTAADTSQNANGILAPLVQLLQHQVEVSAEDMGSAEDMDYFLLAGLECLHALVCQLNAEDTAMDSSDTSNNPGGFSTTIREHYGAILHLACSILTKSQSVQVCARTTMVVEVVFQNEQLFTEPDNPTSCCDVLLLKECGNLLQCAWNLCQLLTVDKGVDDTDESTDVLCIASSHRQNLRQEEELQQSPRACGMRVLRVIVDSDAFTSKHSFNVWRRILEAFIPAESAGNQADRPTRRAALVFFNVLLDSSWVYEAQPEEPDSPQRAHVSDETWREGAQLITTTLASNDSILLRVLAYLALNLLLTLDPTPTHPDFVFSCLQHTTARIQGPVPVEGATEPAEQLLCNSTLKTLAELLTDGGFWARDGGAAAMAMLQEAIQRVLLDNRFLLPTTFNLVTELCASEQVLQVFGNDWLKFISHVVPVALDLLAPLVVSYRSDQQPQEPEARRLTGQGDEASVSVYGAIFMCLAQSLPLLFQQTQATELVQHAVKVLRVAVVSALYLQDDHLSEGCYSCLKLLFGHLDYTERNDLLQEVIPFCFNTCVSRREISGSNIRMETNAFLEHLTRPEEVDDEEWDEPQEDDAHFEEMYADVRGRENVTINMSGVDSKLEALSLLLALFRSQSIVPGQPAEEQVVERWYEKLDEVVMLTVGSVALLLDYDVDTVRERSLELLIEVFNWLSQRPQKGNWDMAVQGIMCCLVKTLSAERESYIVIHNAVHLASRALQVLYDPTSNSGGRRFSSDQEHSWQALRQVLAAAVTSAIIFVVDTVKPPETNPTDVQLHELLRASIELLQALLHGAEAHVVEGCLNRLKEINFEF
jgi:hypothetical protein